ncbi:HEAT repeat domain-containing protein, partial [Actinomadura sp. LOL_011]
MTGDPRTDVPSTGGRSRQDVSAERDAYVAGRDQRVTVTVHHHGEARAKPVRLRVFVSWTSDDLRDHRDQVRRALRRAGVEAVESDAGTRPLDEHLDEHLDTVRGCDLFLGVVAWRYGPVPEGREHSLPELELRAARDAGVTCLTFLLSDEVPWPRSQMDRGDALARVEALRDGLEARADCEHFTGAADLAARVEELVQPLTVGDDAAPRTDPATAAHWHAYRRRLVEEYGRLDLEALTPPEREEYLQLWLRDVFVEPDVRRDAPPVELSKELLRKLQDATELAPSDVPRGRNREDLEQARRVYRTRPRRPVFDVVARPAERTCVLLGDPGAGKSTVARYLALALAQDRLPGRLAGLDGHQPVLIELRDYAAERARARCADFGEYLAHRARTNGLGLPREVLESHLAADGPALVIFDGLDELFEPREREAVAREIAWFASSHPSARVLVTSRVVGYRRRVLEDSGFAHYTVQDLDDGQIQEFLTSWYELALHDRPALAEQRRLRLTGAIDESPPIRELAGNPLLLTILAIIGKHRELPRERWKVYDHAAGVLVEHWDVNKHLRDARVDADVIREDDKKDLLRRLAYRMQLGTGGLAGNHIWMDDLVEEIVDYLRGRFQYDLAHATAIANVIVAQFHERNFVLARYGPRVYGFVHRALLEFFCASEIVARFEKTRVLTEEQLYAEVFDAHWEDPVWTEVLRLVTGMVDATVTDRLLETLLRRARPVRTPVLDRRPPGAVTLAVQCLGEVRSLGNAGRAARTLLESVIELLQAPDRSFADDRRERLESVILPAIAGVGPAWPGRDLFLAWFRERADGFVTDRARRLAPRMLAALYADAPSVRALLGGMARHGGVPAQRSACLLAVADRWPTLAETRDLATGLLRDHAAPVREAAVEVLAANRTDAPATRAAVLAAVLDASADVRQTAVEQLTAHWPDDPEVRAAVHGRLGDPNRDVREAALEQLASSRTDDPAFLDAAHRATQDPDWSVRQTALRVLTAARPRAEESLDTLRHAAADPDEDVRQTAIRLLADRWADAPGTFEAAVDAVGDPDPDAGRAAVEQLVNRWPDHPGTAAALRRARRSPHGGVQCAALVAAVRGGAGDPIAALLDRVSASPNEDVRRAAVEMLAPYRAEHPEILPAVLRATADPEPVVRKAAVRTLARHWPGRPELRAACLAGLREWDAEARQTSLELLACHWGDDPDLLPVFVTGARDPAWMVRKVALETLAARGHDRREAVDALERLSRDAGGLIRGNALEALVTLGAGGRVDDALGDPHRGARRSARAMLAGRHRAAWTDRDRLAEALRSPRSAVREAALGSLVERFGTEEATWDAVEAALNDGEPDVRLLALHAALAAGRDDDRTRAAVSTAARDPDPEVRRVALEALLVRRRSDAATEDAVRRMLDDPDTDVHRIALEALVLADPDGSETLEALARHCAHPTFEIRRAALHALAARRPVPPRAFGAVLEAAANSKTNVRRSCLEALSLRWRAAEEAFACVRRATDDPEPDVRLTAIEALVSRWPDRPETLEQVRRSQWDDSVTNRDAVRHALAFLDADRDLAPPLDRAAAAAAAAHPDARVRLTGLSRLLLAWPDAAATRRAVRIAFHDPFWPVRRVATADLLRRAPADTDAAAVLRSGLDSPSGAVRQLAHWGVANMLRGGPTARATVLRAFGDVESYVRDTAVDLLVFFWADDAASAGPLLDAVRDQDPTVRMTGGQWLATLRPRAPETASALARLVHDPADSVRETALEALLVVRPDEPETAAALGAVARDPHRDHRDTARRALARGTRGRTRAFGETLRAAEHGHRAERADAVAELADRWPDAPEARSVLHRAAADEDEFVRDNAVYTLVGLGWRDPGAVDVLLRAARDSSADARLTSIQALSNGAHPGDPYDLAVAAAGDPHWATRVMALRRLATRWPDRAGTVPIMRQAIGDPDWWARALAHRVLHQYARHRDERPWAVTCDPHQTTHVETRELLSSGPRPLGLTPSGLLPLWGDDPASRERAALITARLHGDDPALRPRLVAAALGDDHAVHAPALDALATWWPDDPETSGTLTRATGHPCARIREFALATLYTRAGEPEAVRRLALAALDDPAPPVRMTSLVLLQLRGRLDAPALLRLAADPDQDVAEHAIRSLALQEPDDPHVWAALREAAGSCPDPDLRY